MLLQLATLYSLHRPAGLQLASHAVQRKRCSR